MTEHTELEKLEKSRAELIREYEASRPARSTDAGMSTVEAAKWTLAIVAIFVVVVKFI